MFKQLKKLHKDSQGFTLVELMIVVAIIGILAAIAIPQFAAYRVRSINATAKSVAHNAKAAEANLNSELGCFGNTEAAAVNLTVAAAAAAAADSSVDTALAGPASATANGGRLSGLNVVSGKDFAIPYGIGANMVAQVTASVVDSNGVVGSCPSGGCSYVIHARAIQGDTGYAMDSDVESILYSVSNPTWVSAGAGLQATPVLAVDSADDLVGIAGGGVPAPGNWTPAF